MSNLIGRSLRVLDRIFSSDRALAFQDIDTEARILPVCDVGRLAAYGRIETDSRAGGFFMEGQTNAHTLANTVTTNFNPYATLDPTWGRTDERWLWIYRLFASADRDDSTPTAFLSMRQAAVGAALVARNGLLIAAFDTEVVVDSATGNGNALLPRDRPFIQLPLLLSPGSTLTWRSTNTNGATNPNIRIDIFFLVLPAGIYPPIP